MTKRNIRSGRGGFLNIKYARRIFFLVVPFFWAASHALASSNSVEAEAGGHAAALTLLWLSIVLLAAKFSSLVEIFGQPAVLGEIIIGVIIGNLALVGFHLLEPIKSDASIAFLAELGVIILLFQIGLESNLNKMIAVGKRSFLVAVVGVVVPFVLGAYVAGPWLLPGLSTSVYLFLAAALTATSVGITARVFKDLNKLQTPEAQIVLGAAVIDDVIGLIILAVVSAIVTAGTVSILTVGIITLKAILFFIGAIAIGQLGAARLSRLFAAINTGVGMKFTLAVSFGLIFAYVATLMGMAPIVGAFAAGLILDPVHFVYFKDPHIVDDLRRLAKNTSEDVRRQLQEVIETHSQRHLEDIIQPIGYFLVPIFFVMTGMSVRLETLLDPKIIIVAVVITIIAFIGKVVAGYAAGPVSKSIVGWGMAPRGEVGLIFANIGKALGVVSDSVFSVIVIVVILTTLLTPPILAYLLRRQSSDEASAAPPSAVWN